ncbi:MAG: ADP-ribosylglycohydrolase family protein [Chloroflexota bacterium]
MSELNPSSPLFKKVYGCLLGGAIGDALGGPVEHATPDEIERRASGIIDRYLPYERPPGYHAHFGEGERIGAYTDDTRMKHIYCRAIFHAGGKPRAGDLAHILAEAYHHAPDEMHAGLYEEYYFKGMWRSDKLIYAGEPTNGALMANSPLGLIAACRPDEAYQLGFDLSFFTDGHAKSAAAMMVCAIATSMTPGVTIDEIIEQVRASHLRFARRREGDQWHTLPWRYDPNLKFLDEALKIAREAEDVFAIREPLYALLEWGHLFSESIHTLCVAVAMFVASKGDFRLAVQGAIMYGRDKDSYASVVGALIGAYHGVDVIPTEWIQPVIDGNPEVDMRAYASRLTEIISDEINQRLKEADVLRRLAG